MILSKVQYRCLAFKNTLATPLKRVIILGSGWGGFKVLNGLDPKKYNLVCVSPRNYFLFTPLLASTAVGTLEFRAITEPVRNKSNTYYAARCSSINFDKREISCTIEGRDEKFCLAFDLLVISVGAYSNTFNIPGVNEYAMFLKEISHARAIRRKVIESFEFASEPNVAPQEQLDRLHFCIVGGGPTGIEFAGEVSTRVVVYPQKLHDFITEDLKRLYPNLMDKVKITVFDVADKILSGFDIALSDYASKKYDRKGIEIATRTIIKSVSRNKLTLDNGAHIPFGLLVWATGLTANPLVASLALSKDKTSHIITNEYLNVLDVSGNPIPSVYALGDCATVINQPTPATAQVANQKGSYLAKTLNASAGGLKIQPFFYKNMGMMVYTGGWSAIADFSKTPIASSLKGRLAWLTWRSAYFVMTISWKNRILIPMYWFLTWIFGRDIGKF